LGEEPSASSQFPEIEAMKLVKSVTTDTADIKEIQDVTNKLEAVVGLLEEIHAAQGEFIIAAKSAADTLAKAGKSGTSGELTTSSLGSCKHTVATASEAGAITATTKKLTSEIEALRAALGETLKDAQALIGKFADVGITKDTSGSCSLFESLGGQVDDGSSIASRLIRDAEQELEERFTTLNTAIESAKDTLGKLEGTTDDDSAVKDLKALVATSEKITSSDHKRAENDSTTFADRLTQLGSLTKTVKETIAKAAEDARLAAALAEQHQKNVEAREIARRLAEECTNTGMEQTEDGSLANLGALLKDELPEGTFVDIIERNTETINSTVATVQTELDAARAKLTEAQTKANGALEQLEIDIRTASENGVDVGDEISAALGELRERLRVVTSAGDKAPMLSAKRFQELDAIASEAGNATQTVKEN
jgi:hypothetical protein